MWVYPCFEGDVDMARAGVQHDLYFTCPSRPYVDIFDFQDILMLRYGFECVAETWWAAEVRDRVGAEADASPNTISQRGANA